VDIEDRKTEALKTNTTWGLEAQKIGLIRQQAHLTYYMNAERFLNVYTFKDAQEKYIWDLHSQGLGPTEILEKLRRRTYKNPITTRFGIWRLIARLKPLVLQELIEDDLLNGDD
jgi:hypothetical protein